MMSNIIGFAVFAAVLICIVFALAMLVIRLRYDLLQMYDKYNIERVKRLDDRRKHEMREFIKDNGRPYTTRSEYFGGFINEEETN